MKNAVIVTALAGLATAASAQSVAINFAASASEIAVGDTVTFTVSAAYTGLSPEGYFGGFVGSFLASGDLGVAGNFQNFMAGEGIPPVADGANINDINVFNNALIGTNDASIGEFFSFDVVATAEGMLSYNAAGVSTLFNSDFIFDPRIDLTAQVTSDTVNILVPAPGAAALLGLGGLVATRRRR